MVTCDRFIRKDIMEAAKQGTAGKRSRGNSGKSSRISGIFLGLLFLVGVGLLVYPTFSDWWNSFHQSRAIMDYTSSITDMDSASYKEILEAAEEYNRKLAKKGINWTLTDKQIKQYNKQLAIDDSGIMGYIQIDKIHVMLPIYHGTDETVLQTSIGHLQGTSLPVGCASFDPREGKVTDSKEGSHCVLSGHRGLPSAKLFSDLDKMVEGDIFTLNILDETLTYQVDRIRVVEPDDLSELQIKKGRDLCTLVTCTPYGINTQRLLVRGHRVANAMGDIKVVADALQIESVYVAPFIAVPILLLLIIYVVLHSDRMARDRKSRQRTERIYKKEMQLKDGHKTDEV